MLKRCFGDREFIGKLMRLTWPIALQSLMLAAVAAADAFMLGRIEQNSMAAVSLASQVQFIQNMLLGAATGAGAILGAQYWGRGDRITMQEIFCMMIRLNGIVSVAFFVMCIGIPEYLMRLFASDPELIRIGSEYLRIAGWSYLFTGISQCYLTFMKVTEHVKASAFISSFAVVMNIILNSILIFGYLGAPAMGAHGAAIATLIARVMELALCVILSFRPGFVHPELKWMFRHNPVLWKDFAKCALPLLGGGLFWGIGFTSYTAFMGHMGADAAAANSIAAVVRDLICCVCNGISSAGGIMVGNELGAGKLEKGREYGKRLAFMSFMIGFASTLVVILLTPLVLSFIHLTPEAQSLLWGMMLIMAVYMIGRCVNTVVINGVFAAGGDTLFDMYSLAVCMWGIAVPLAALGTFVFHWPVLLVYACTCLDEVGKIPWVMAHFRKYKWVRDLTKERKEGEDLA